MEILTYVNMVIWERRKFCHSRWSMNTLVAESMKNESSVKYRDNAAVNIFVPHQLMEYLRCPDNLSELVATCGWKHSFSEPGPNWPMTFVLQINTFQQRQVPQELVLADTLMPRLAYLLVQVVADVFSQRFFLHTSDLCPWAGKFQVKRVKM